MSRSRRVRSFLMVVLVALGGAGCLGDAPVSEPSGSLMLSLELAGGEEVDEVRWTISGGAMEPMSGVVDSSNPGATASVEVFGLPPGVGYLVALEAVTTDETIACSGDATFDVKPGAVTEVMVMLNCAPADRLGGVRVNGVPNTCAELVKVVVSPLQTSLGDEIELFAEAFDADGDTITYEWLSLGGSIADPSSPSTTFTCEELGSRLIGVRVSDGPYPCEDLWVFEVQCVESDPALLMCRPSEETCNDAPIDPTLPCCNQGAPEQVNACTGSESLANPTTCTRTGSSVTHRLNVLELAPSCNIGYDLDACFGHSCIPGGLASWDGAEGVDNALTASGTLFDIVGGNLAGFNQAFSDALCGYAPGGLGCRNPIDPLEIELSVDANLEERCANVRIQSGSDTNDVILNLGEPTESGTVCASGTIGTIPIGFQGFAGSLDNAVVRMTVSEDGFTDGLLGTTLGSSTAIQLAELILPGAGAVIAQIFDIDDELERDASRVCDAMSATFVIEGGEGPVEMPGSPVIPYDRTDPLEVTPFPDDNSLQPDSTMPTGYRVSLTAPPREPDVQVLYLALINETWWLDGFSPVGGFVIELDAAPDTGTLPLTPHESLEPSATVRLFDLTPGSATFGKRVPFDLTPISRRLPGQAMNHSLVAYPSIPLDSRGRYAMVVTRDLLTNDGRPYEPSPFMTEVLGPEQPGEAPEVAKARGLLADGVLDVLADESIVSPPILPDEMALVFRVTVRSTEDIRRTPLSMKEQVAALPAPGHAVDSVYPGPGMVAATVRGTWEAPNWRENTYFIARDPNGDPRITGTLSVPFVLALPEAAEDGPVPIVMFQHGSPGTAEGAEWEAYSSLAEAGFAVIGMTDTLNRELGTDGDYQSRVIFETLITKWQPPDYAMQTYGDQMMFLRFIETLGSLDIVPYPNGDGVPDLDLDAPLGYVGISMGSVHGGAFLAYAPEIKAAALVVGAQRQGEQYFNGGAFIDNFPPELGELIPNATPFDYWVGLSIFQMRFDHQDQHNHARHLYREPLEVAGTTRKASVLVLEGLNDFDVPNNATRSLAWTVGPIPHLEPIWDPSPILESTTGAVTGNIDAQTTAAFYQYVPAGVPGILPTPSCANETNGHYCAQDAEEALLQRRLFLRSSVENAVPTITDPLSVAP